jgi:hypothetical protein
LTDEFRPNDKLDLNLGVRYERFEYDLAQPGADFPFWYNAASNVYCYNLSTLAPLVATLVPGQQPPAPPIQTTGSCPSGFAHPSKSDPANTRGLVYSAGTGGVLSSTIWSPRVGFTYTVNPDTVIRASYGRYAEPVTTATVQYLDKSGKGSASTNFTNFFRLGFTTPTHPLSPQTSNNSDLSIEKRLHGTDISFKLSPFYRYTTNQLNSISIGPNFVSAINGGTQRSYGVEFALSKGDPTRNGLSGTISYTYTNTRIKFGNLSNGRNTIDPINDYIIAYNRLTSACNGSTSQECIGYGSNPLPAITNYSCYANDGSSNAGTCTGAGSPGITNPYYNNKPQPLLDRSGWYDTYPNEFPYAAPGGETTAIAPSAFSGFLSYKHDKFSITPTFQLNEGVAYGSPVSVYGYDPRYCSQNQGSPLVDSKGNTVLPVVASGPPNTANFLSCGSTIQTADGYLAIPNPKTGSFDSLAQYRDPWQFNLGLQVGYDVSNKVHANLILANLVNRCFGGTKSPWSTEFKPGGTVCGYGADGSFYQSNFYNGAGPNDPVNGPIAPVFQQPYSGLGALLPFNAYFSVNVKL